MLTTPEQRVALEKLGWKVYDNYITYDYDWVIDLASKQLWAGVYTERLSTVAQAAVVLGLVEDKERYNTVLRVADKNMGDADRFYKENESLRHRVKVLEEALKPFALLGMYADNAVDGQLSVWVSDICKAADAMEGK